MADVSIDATVSTATARGCRCLVFPTPDIGYCFYIDGGGGLAYSKTSDGGGTWGAAVSVNVFATTIAFDVWFDQWTPGDAGTLIHIWFFDSTNDIVYYRSLNTTGDVFGTSRIAFTGASAVAGRGAFVSGTKTRSGYLYVAYDIDAGAERGLHRSTDSGVNWSANLSTTFIEATLDTCKLFPASGTGDDHDCWALYYDASATALTLKLWDSSAVSQVESATIGAAHTDGPTDLTGQYGYDGTIRHSDGHLLVAKVSLRDNATSQHQVFDITSTSTITTKTNITTNIDDHYYPQIFINQTTGTIFVAYNGKRDGSEVLDTTTKVYYTSSTDGGTTWAAGDTAYLEGAAGVVQQVWSPIMGSRFYVVWRVAGTLLGNKVNSLIQLGAILPTIAGTAVLTAPTVVPGAVTVAGTTIPAAAAAHAPPTLTPAIAAATIPSTARFVYTETLLAEQATSNANLSWNLVGRQGAQTISGHAGVLTSVSLYLAKSGAPALLGSVYLELREGAFNGTLLATSASVPAASFSTGTPAWFNFSLPGVVLTAGTTYWIEGYLTQTESAAVAIYESTLNPYAGGARTNSSGTLVPGEDWRFRLYTGTSHTVAVVAAADQGITTESIAAGSSATAPSVAAVAGDQAVTGVTLVAASAVSVPTISAGAVTLIGASRASASQVFACTVTAGAVTLSGATCAATSLVRVPTIAVGAVTLTGATLAVASVALVPTVTTGAVTLTGATVTTTGLVRVPAIAPGAVTVTTATIAATSLPFLPVVSQAGVTAIGGATLTTGAQVRVPTVSAGPVVLTAATCTSTLQLFAPSLEGVLAIGGATLSTASQVQAPTLSAGAVTLTAAACASTTQLFMPSLVGVVVVTGPTLGSTVATWAPSVSVAIPPVGAQVSIAFTDTGLTSPIALVALGMTPALDVVACGLQQLSDIEGAGVTPASTLEGLELQPATGVTDAGLVLVDEGS